jgi:hypothetical protein
MTEDIKSEKPVDNIKVPVPSEVSDNKVKINISKNDYDKVKKEYLEDQNNPNKKKQPKFWSFFKWKTRMKMNKSLKKSDEILVFLLNLKKQIEGPILTKIYGGNFLVIRSHVYRFNPDRVFSFGKYKAIIAREFDRELVGIDDYENLVVKDFLSKNPGGRVNIDDPVLIKALIQAKLSEKQPVAGGMKWAIIILVIVGLIIGFFMLTGKKATPPTTG